MTKEEIFKLKDISQFKLIKNRQRPEMCFSYEKVSQSGNCKLSIFTLNYGNHYLASVLKLNGYTVNTY